MIQILKETDVAEAARLLMEDELVAIPTETVYGLGANAFSRTAVEKIFTVKGRPSDNPLIIHILSAEDLPRYCREIPAAAYRVAERFWPGPLTLVLKKQPCVPDFITAGLDTVAIRCPMTEVTRQLLALLPYPVAAPSANLSGRPSTTSVAHVVEDLSDKIPAVLDGGDCEVGLESTILDLSTEVPCLLRPGGVTLESLREVLGTVTVDKALTQTLGEGEKPKAPGMKYRHYAPKAPMSVVRGNPERTARYIAENAQADDGVLCFDEYAFLFEGRPYVYHLGGVGDQESQAHRLFEGLRHFDKFPVKRIFAQASDDTGLGLAIMNRMSKAAGFHFIDV